MDVCAIEARGVRKAYGANEVLRGLDLSVPRGQIVGFIGLNGAGKSTMLAILLGLLRADAGEIQVLGTPPERVAFLGGRVGVALHRPGLEADLTVRQNLRLHALRYGKGGIGADDVMERLDLARLSVRRVAKLSQGERQRLALARALLLEPELLVLDEPLSNLDPRAVHRVLDVLVTQKARGATVLLSSHQLDHVERIADRIALLHRGRLVLEGTVPEVLTGKSGQRTYLVALRGDRAARPFDGMALVASHAEVDASERDRIAPNLDAARDTLFRVQLVDDAPERLNAALVAGGSAVALLRPERASLDELFQRITTSEAAA